MAIVIKCTCGRTLKIDERYRGKQAACPGCKAPILVDGPSDEPAIAVEIEPEPAPPKTVPSKAPAKPVTPPPEPKSAKKKQKEERASPKDDPDDPFGIPSGDSAPGSPRPHSRSWTLWIVSGCTGFVALLSCCGGIGFGVWYFFFKGPEADLAFVHDGVIGFYSFRVADVMKTRAVKDGINEFRHEAIDKKEFEKKLADIEGKLGMSLADLERATFIIPPKNVEDHAVVLLTNKTFKKTIKNKILSTFSKGQEEETHNGAKYYVMKRDGHVVMVVHFVSDKVMLITHTAAGMKDFLSGADKGATDPAMKRGIGLVSSGRHMFVAAFRNSLVRESLAQEANPASLNDVTGVVLSGNVDAKLDFEIVATFQNSDAAAKAKSDIEAAPDGRMARDMKEAGVKITHRGNELVGTGQARFPTNILISLVISPEVRDAAVQKEEKKGMKGPKDPDDIEK